MKLTPIIIPAPIPILASKTKLGREQRSIIVVINGKIISKMRPRLDPPFETFTVAIKHKAGDRRVATEGFEILLRKRKTPLITRKTFSTVSKLINYSAA